MKRLLLFITSIIIFSSCVSKTKYEELEHIKNDQLRRMNDLVLETEQKNEELKEENEELKAMVDELSDRIFLMSNAMEHAYDSYHFGGADDSFTKMAIDELYRYY